MSDWIKTAKVGDKVVCVDGGNTRVCRPLSAGSVYTIREIDEWHGKVGILLVGVVNPFFEDGLEFGCLPSRFRPVDPRKTDITIFTDMLKSVGKQVPEVV